ncbi:MULTISPECIES: hypothetical protein [unclassified Halobacteriovorax]|uniref:hypothetical protein n=1 Tax=unclassified Halobacteriovorax TaxID=2639665 RepID=UPI00399B536B
MAETRQDGALIVVTGKSRSGKSAWVKAQIEQYARQLVFDIKGEYSEQMGYTVVRNLVELADLLQATPGPLKVAYRPASPVKEFGTWAKAAFTWCKMSPCAILAEELADVTTPAKAPDGWGQVCRQAQGFGAVIYAITQRPSESDKTAMGNATLIHCCKMVRASDREYMAREMDVKVEELNALMDPMDDQGKPTKGPHWIEKCLKSNQVKKGKLTFH